MNEILSSIALYALGSDMNHGHRQALTHTSSYFCSCLVLKQQSVKTFVSCLFLIAITAT